MFHIPLWIAVITLLALWSVSAWALHAVGAWTLSNAGALSGTATGLEGLRIPAWMAQWVPPEFVQAGNALMTGLEPLVQALLQAAPALADGFTVVAWLVWGVGSIALLVLGVASHALIARWRRRGDGQALRPGSVLTAG